MDILQLVLTMLGAILFLWPILAVYVVMYAGLTLRDLLRGTPGLDSGSDDEFPDSDGAQSESSSTDTGLSYYDPETESSSTDIDREGYTESELESSSTETGPGTKLAQNETESESEKQLGRMAGAPSSSCVAVNPVRKGRGRGNCSKSPTRKVVNIGHGRGRGRARLVNNEAAPGHTPVSQAWKKGRGIGWYKQYQAGENKGEFKGCLRSQLNSQKEVKDRSGVGHISPQSATTTVQERREVGHIPPQQPRSTARVIQSPGVGHIPRQQNMFLDMAGSVRVVAPTPSQELVFGTVLRTVEEELARLENRCSHDLEHSVNNDGLVVLAENMIDLVSRIQKLLGESGQKRLRETGRRSKVKFCRMAIFGVCVGFKEKMNVEIGRVVDSRRRVVVLEDRNRIRRICEDFDKGVRGLLSYNDF